MVHREFFSEEGTFDEFYANAVFDCSSNDTSDSENDSSLYITIILYFKIIYYNNSNSNVNIISVKNLRISDRL